MRFIVLFLLFHFSLSFVLTVTCFDLLIFTNGLQVGAGISLYAVGHDVRFNVLLDSIVQNRDVELLVSLLACNSVSNIFPS